MIWGKRIPTSAPTGAASTRRRCPAARFVELERAGHWPWIDEPELVGSLCDFFAARITPPLQSSVVSRPISYIGSRLPRGWSDLLLQLALFFGVYQGYQVVRGLSEGKDALAFANADRVVDLERSLGLFFERGLQAAMLNFDWVIDGANWMYVNSHFIITTTFLAWLYLFRNEHFYFVRNMFMVAMLLALTGYLLSRRRRRGCSRQRLVDTIATFSGVNTDSNAVSLLVNKYAAVPSMHIGFALMIAGVAFLLVRNPVSGCCGSATRCSSCSS